MFVVGIGASAGGLDAIVKFFKHAEKLNIPVCYVVIQHLSPSNKSYMQDIMADKTKLPVKVITDNEQPESDVIYLCPPGKLVTIKNNRFQLEAQPAQHSPNRAIDHFFSSIARHYQDYAIGVILSGSGSDGSQGCISIYQEGGEIFIQDPSEAEFAGMPDSVIQVCHSSNILPTEEIFQAIVEHISQDKNQSSNLLLLKEIGTRITKFSEVIHENLETRLEDYKETTVCRRIAKRMTAVGQTNVDAYLETLKNVPDELVALADDIFIGVSSFFRDREFYDLLIKELKLQIKQHPQNIRIWIPGCSSGQEVYSFLILLLEQLDSEDELRNITLFATDINQTQLDSASRGVYRKEQLEGLTDEQRKNFFHDQGKGFYQIQKHVRDKVVFSRHNVIDSPPFSNIDIVSCRNLLIYLKPEAQKKALHNLSFALKEKGLLALGSSESLGEEERFFKTVDSKWRLYRKIHNPLRKRKHSWSPVISEGIDRSKLHSPLRLSPSNPMFFGQVFESLNPNSMIIDEEYNLVAIYGKAHELIKQNVSGLVSSSINQLFRSDIGIPILTALKRTQTEKTDICYQGVNLDEHAWTMRFRWFSTNSQVFYLGSLENPVKSNQTVQETVYGDEKAISLLQDELTTTKQALELNIRELETTNEELQTTNEELIASNEELQSTNEELNSVNEELYTLNNELQVKIHDVTHINSDLENLIRSTNVGVIFLDMDFNIRTVSDNMASNFQVRRADVGRSIFELSFGAALKAFKQRGLGLYKNTRSTEVISSKGEYHQCSMLPYKDEQGNQTGYVVTVVNINDAKQREIFLHQTEQDAKIGGWVLDTETGKTHWSEQVYRIYGIPNTTPTDVAQGLLSYTRKDQDRLKQYLAECKQGHEFADEFELIDANKKRLFVKVTGQPIFSPLGEVVKIRGTLQDVTEQRYERERSNLAIRAGNVGVWDLDLRSDRLEWNDQMYQIYEVQKTNQQLLYKDWVKKVHPDDIEQAEISINESKYEGEAFSTEYRILTEQGVKTIKTMARTYYDEFERPVRLIGVDIDITTLKDREKAVLKAKEKSLNASKLAAIGELASNIGHEINNPLAIASGNMDLIKEYLKEKAVLDDWIVSHITNHNDAVNRISEIVSGLRTMVRDESKKHKTPIDVSDLLNKMAAFLREMYEALNISIEISALEEKLLVQGHNSELQQVLMNLISNARDALEESDEKVIQLAAEKISENELCISVTDSGCGMSPEEIGNIFNIFYTTKPPGKGTGLGLSIAYRVVAAHDGRIEVHSTPGSGSNFKIYLPILKAKHEPSNSPEKATDSNTETSNESDILKGKKALVVDDETPLLEILAAYISSTEMEVDTAESGETAIEQLKTNHYDVLISDLSMKGISGYQLIEWCQANLQNTPKTILLTGATDPELTTPDHAFQKGVNQIVYKPCKRETILTAICKVLTEKLRSEESFDI